ncbi:auxin-responsive protein IAA25-like [Dioscorea cayenensis subsp. rotundata]|uniref:Auxin-responsive protein n=1 Tax=Dioscorea cayennensis subsp. rotundata TaxID=55577 RepID=A0AB40B5T2_DIOCR|nr:auxin-responsive protein IAA25-like [Dioscorea cayenensis subsp. rotundata]
MNIRATVLMETATTTTTTAAATTTATTVVGKEDQEGELGQEDGGKKRLSLGLQNNLELRLGISMNNNNGFQEMDRSSIRRSQEGLVLQRNSGHEVGTGIGVGGGGSKRSWLSDTAAACGFVHPWSLAARQEKAALEQAHHKASIPSTSSLSRVNGHSAQAQPVVGWPPVRTFRRNLAGSQATKQEMESEKEAKKAKSLMEMEKVANNINHVQSKPTMFVKVNMEGYAVGRKIDLKAHDSYDSLSKSLQKMFQNFLSVNIQGIITKENERVDAVKNNYILLYALLNLFTPSIVMCIEFSVDALGIANVTTLTRLIPPCSAANKSVVYLLGQPSNASEIPAE